MTRLHYHPCPHALGEYDYHTDTIILHEGLKHDREVHDRILSHEREHASIFLEHNSWIMRLALNVRLDYKARVTGSTKVPMGLMKKLYPSSLGYDVFRALYLLAYLPLIIFEGLMFTFRSLLGSE
jgi:hypothetical protein